MKKGLLTGFVLLAVAVVEVFASDKPMRELRPLLESLDKLIDRRTEIFARYEHRIDSLKGVLRRPRLSPETRYDLTEELANLYFSYQSDSTIVYLRRGLDIARELDDNNLKVRAKSNMALCYSLNGRFFEAEQELAGIVDTLTMDRKARVIYYVAQHRKNRELQYQSEAGSSERELLRGAESYYAARVVETSEDPAKRLYYSYLSVMNDHDWKRAEVFCDSLLSLCPPDSHTYAKAANHKASIEGGMGHADQRICWLVRSAMVDIQASIRDYGSLVSVAEELLALGDVDRAMRYIRIAINDTRFYNSPIRSWRDMAILPQIDKAYSERNARLHTMYIVLILITALFAVTAVCFVLYVMCQNRRLNAVQQTLRESNDKLNLLADSLRQTNRRLLLQNIRIADANRIKEVYIGGFLKMISEYINKLADTYRYVNKMLRNDRIDELKREYAGSNVRNDELKEFYALFDSTFLHLYPSFIDEFNRLLTDEARITVRREASLTTELRIFALIRLGITGTTTIAALLHCSVNTVYSYRSRLRLHSRAPECDLEQQVAMIGISDPEQKTTQ